ncbi:MAG TPA: hypothetical protein VK137_10960 [Planctomycetaceae bacterium]|nr:hypothetical protein [Planctomycetaceae bacterium]
MPRVCAAFDVYVMSGAGELGAFPQGDSPPFLSGDDAGGRVRGDVRPNFRKGSAMLTTLKLFGLSTVVACGTCFGVCDAQACGGGRCGGCAVQSRCCAPACAAPAAAPATDAPPPPAEHQHNSAANRQRYQSAYQAPAYAPMRSYGSRSSSDQFGAGRKILGRFGN